MKHLPTLDESEWPMQHLEKRRGKTSRKLATHNPIAHILGIMPCVILRGYSKEEKRRVRKYFNYTHVYPLVHERNIVKVLIHEDLHCVIQDIDEHLEEHGLGLDNLIPDIADMAEVT